MKHSHIIDSKIIRVAFLLNLSLDTGMKFDFLGPTTKKVQAGHLTFDIKNVQLNINKNLYHILDNRERLADGKCC
jgi:hypothetical protein